MKSNLIIRHYTPSDKATLLQLIQENIPTYFAAEEAADFETYLDTEIEAYFVVELNGIIVGCGGVNFAENKTIGIISWGMIHPQYHGQTIGTSLLHYRLNYLKNSERVQKIRVRTSQLVYRFYEKNGFQVVETKKDYWASGIDLYTMEYEQ